MGNNQSKMTQPTYEPLPDLAPNRVRGGATRTCDVPFCDKVCVESPLFSHDNITCMRCENFHCDDCSKKIWSGEWQGEVFYKPKMLIPGLKHEVFRCAFCRASFDRMEQV